MEAKMDNQKLEMLCEIVKFQRSILPLLSEISMSSPAKSRKVQIAFERLNKKVCTVLQDELNVELLDFTGSQYEEGLPLEPMNIEDFEGVDDLVIVNMIEPVVKEKGTSNILRNGKVILAEAK